MTQNRRYKHTPRFAKDERGISQFKGIRPRDIPKTVPIAEHLVTASRRIEQLSEYYYQAPRLWYRIADANPQFMFGPDLVLDPQGKDPLPEHWLRVPDMIGGVILIPEKDST